VQFESKFRQQVHKALLVNSSWKDRYVDFVHSQPKCIIEDDFQESLP
jgi:hypothetical protein